jgi:hypothetical protein
MRTEHSLVRQYYDLLLKENTKALTVKEISCMGTKTYIWPISVHLDQFNSLIQVSGDILPQQEKSTHKAPPRINRC